MTTIFLFVFLDRGIMSSVLATIESSDKGLGLSASEAGSLGSVFIVGFIFMAPVYAYLA